LIIDTHGQNTIEPVWELLAEAYRSFDLFPSLMERDSNIPPLADLLVEVERICAFQKSHRLYRSTHEISEVAV